MFTEKARTFVKDKLCVLVSTILVLTACTSGAPAPMENRLYMSLGPGMAEFPVPSGKPCGALRSKVWGIGYIDPTGRYLYTVSTSDNENISVTSIRTGKSIGIIHTPLSWVKSITWISPHEALVVGGIDQKPVKGMPPPYLMLTPVPKGTALAFRTALVVLDQLPTGRVVRKLAFGPVDVVPRTFTPVISHSDVFLLTIGLSIPGPPSVQLVNFTTGRIVNSTILPNGYSAGSQFNIFKGTSGVFVYGGGPADNKAFLFDSDTGHLKKTFTFGGNVSSIGQDPRNRNMAYAIITNPPSWDNTRIDHFDQNTGVISAQELITNKSMSPPQMAIDPQSNNAYVAAYDVPATQKVAIWKVPLSKHSFGSTKPQVSVFERLGTPGAYFLQVARTIPPPSLSSAFRCAH